MRGKLSATIYSIFVMFFTYLPQTVMVSDAAIPISAVI
jgi:hypothetical protein